MALTYLHCLEGKSVIKLTGSLVEEEKTFNAIFDSKLRKKNELSYEDSSINKYFIF
jgi:hypothetical protein